MSFPFKEALEHPSKYLLMNLCHFFVGLPPSLLLFFSSISLMPFPLFDTISFSPASIFFSFFLICPLCSLITAFFSTNNTVGYFKTSNEVGVSFLKKYYIICYTYYYTVLFLLYYFVRRTETIWSLWNNIPAYKYK